MKNWRDVHTKDELQKRYLEILPTIMASAQKMGYAIAVHGSMRRDLDLIAMPWVPNARTPETLVLMIQRDLLGYERDTRTSVKREWLRGKKKPHGRIAGAFPIAHLADDFETQTLRHAYLDISVMPRRTNPQPSA